MSKKNLSYCQGCRDNFYNTEGVKAGLSKECWGLKTAKVVDRFRIGWWTQPDQPYAFTKVKTHNCHRAPGQYAHYESLPDFVDHSKVRGVKP